ncbi:MAG TPA: GNAT family N-acetyltransferase, partial [Gammaproteobacteria bacterium]|nr:GNAT family N-acetyltransferase [Gammaproteobacteria bacterium]
RARALLGNSSTVGLNRWVPIRTSRLLIRPFQADDEEALYELHRSEQVMLYAGGTKDREQSRRALENLIRKVATTGFGALALEEILTGRVIGWCGIQAMRDLEGLEITYALSVDQWGQGLACEAASAMMSRAFNELGLERIYGLVFPQNARSIRVLEKLGMVFRRSHLDQSSLRIISVYSTNERSFLNSQSSSK